MPEQRKNDRRDFIYYMQVTDALSKQLIGHLTEISPGGFRLDSRKQIPAGEILRLQIQLASDIAHKDFMVFIARSKWCRRDREDPNTFNVGFEIINMSSADAAIFRRMCENYGSQKQAKSRSYDDYLWG
ncbi:MAG: PilZ domain-containing protein [Chloroflexi bacterium]|nr:MAG: PilZ domain-containing protein [Chloroflexota bacterium]